MISPCRCRSTSNSSRFFNTLRSHTLGSSPLTPQRKPSGLHHSAASRKLLILSLSATSGTLGPRSILGGRIPQVIASAFITTRPISGGFDSLPSAPRRQLVMIADHGRPKVAGPLKRRKDCRSFAEINSFRIQFFPPPRSVDFAELFRARFRGLRRFPEGTLRDSGRLSDSSTLSLSQKMSWLALLSIQDVHIAP
jgi:hypothetical protein